jgi:imidazolonepropionase-like amidohydrolase
MVAGGMTPAQAIGSATAQAARMLEMSGKVGVLAPGAFADLIAVPGSPLLDVKVLEDVRFVMKGGKVVREAR